MMAQHRTRSASCILLLLLTLAFAVYAQAIPSPQKSTSTTSPSASSYWLADIQRQGTVAYGSDPTYNVFRNVKDYGALGDGVTDDTVAINAAISDGNRCGEHCDSSTTTPALVYFPPGTYMVSTPIQQYYYTQLVGDALSLPTLKATSGFEGMAVIDADPYYTNTGDNWFTNQNNFYRQIRNFVIDLTAMPITAGAGIHWQVAQATSLQNIVFNMVSGGGAENKQQGIFMDNGSGGFMADLIFNGGAIGAFLGNQQFTSRNLSFNNCGTAIYMNWNWVWTMKSVNINNCGIGVDMSALENNVNQSVGSIVLLDSVMANTPIGVKTAYGATSLPDTGGTLIIQNVDFTIGVPIAVAAIDGSSILAGGSVIPSWAQGNAYRPQYGSRKVKRTPQVTPFPMDNCTTSQAAISPTATSTAVVSPLPSANSTTPSNPTIPSPTPSMCSASAVPVNGTRVQYQLTAPSMPAALMAGNNIFERSKPQYESLPVSSFVSVKANGAKGDGVTDDTAAIQSIFDGVTADKIVYFDHGAYVITDTVRVPKDIRITGEIWPLIMADGSFFNDSTNPKPVFSVGAEGDIGNVELSDLIFETLGPAPGAIMMEWNVQEASQGSCGLWDVHFRIGGTAGTQLQQDTCQANITDSQTFKPECAGAFLLLHIKQQATAYVENVWLWVADHELDLLPHYQTNIYSGRGMLVESAGPTWLYGTSVEHNQLYNYYIANAQNVFMGAIQTETAYMQSAPNALEGGFPPLAGWDDPNFSTCTTDQCKKTLGLRIANSQDIFMYGGGLYSFFDNYLQTCLDTESCQENMIDIQCSNNVYLYGLTTKASTNMVVVNGEIQALQADNRNMFGSTLALFEAQLTS